MKSKLPVKVSITSRKIKSAATVAGWNPADYAANSAVQQSWAWELIARLKLRGDEHILDVGCGVGKITAELASAVPRGLVVGMDASAEMIGFARRKFSAAEIPNLKFQIADAREINFKNEFDVVFSNAALHWVDDHEAILRGAASVLKAGGRLAIYCGGKGNAHDVFLAFRPEMRQKRWREFFRKMPLPYFFIPRLIMKNGCLKLVLVSSGCNSCPRMRLMPAPWALPHGCARRGCLLFSVCRKICARNS